MSDTPCTDAAIYEVWEGERLHVVEGLTEVVAAEVCRQLERELAEARREADKWANLAAASESVAVKTHLEAEKAQEELEEAQRDAGRYRWIRDLPNADSLNVKYCGVDLDNVVDAEIEDDTAKARGA